jgi:hypothetical protein
VVGTNVAGGSAGGLHHLLLVDDFGEAKVCDFDLGVIGDALHEKIFGLQWKKEEEGKRGGQMMKKMD